MVSKAKRIFPVIVKNVAKIVMADSPFKMVKMIIQKTVSNEAKAIILLNKWYIAQNV